MMAVAKNETDGEGPQFSKATSLIVATIIAFGAILIALLLVASNPIGSGIVLAGGAVIDGTFARRLSGRQAQLKCYAVAVLCLIGGIVLEVARPPLI